MWGRQKTIKSGAYIGLLAIMAVVCLLGKAHARQRVCVPVLADSTVVFPEGSFPVSSDLFLVGEAHSAPLLPAIKLGLIEWLHTNAGVTDIYIETGTGAAWLYNCFLATGDTSFITHPDLVYNQTPAEKKFWRSLYQWNRSVRAGIVIRGFDFERMEWIKVLQILSARERTIGTTLLNNLDSFKVERVNSGNLSALLQIFRKDLTKDSVAWQRVFGNQLGVVLQMLGNSNTWLNYQHRDSTMFLNLLDSIKSRPKGRAVVFAGNRHGLSPTRTGTLFNSFMQKSGTPRQPTVISILSQNFNISKHTDDEQEYDKCECVSSVWLETPAIKNMPKGANLQPEPWLIFTKRLAGN